MNQKLKNQIPVVDSFNDSNIKVFALGGLGEVGKNMYCIESGNELLIIDSGIMFPDSGFGIDYIIPDYTYLINNNNNERYPNILAHEIIPLTLYFNVNITNITSKIIPTTDTIPKELIEEWISFE